MQWRHNWPMRQPRPKVRRLSATEQKGLLAALTRAIERSPVLSAFALGVRFARGRFYVERPLASGVEGWGRITPVAKGLLLEVGQRSPREMATGSPQKVIDAIAGDTRGTFHGMGVLDAALRKAGQGLTRVPVNVDGGKFTYADSGGECTVQEALFHFFGLPIEVIAEPARWYSCHRTPGIVAFSEDRTRVFVRFTAWSISGSFGGTCLYAQRDGQWLACPIKPSESESIATAEAWLVRRKWVGWPH